MMPDSHLFQKREVTALKLLEELAALNRQRLFAIVQDHIVGGLVLCKIALELHKVQHRLLDRLLVPRQFPRGRFDRSHAKTNQQHRDMDWEPSDGRATATPRLNRRSKSHGSQCVHPG